MPMVIWGIEQFAKDLDQFSADLNDFYARDEGADGDKIAKLLISQCLIIVTISSMMSQ